MRIGSDGVRGLALMRLLSVDAQEAIFQARAVEALAKTRTIPRRQRRRRPRRREANRLLIELCVGRVLACAESYLLMAATRRLKPALITGAPPVRPDTMTKSLRSAAKSFERLKTIWSNDLGTDLQKLNSWDDFNNLRELRHVLVHRLGAWQPGIDPKPGLLTRIKALGENPDLYRGPVPLDADELPKAVEKALALVDEIDKLI